MNTRYTETDDVEMGDVKGVQFSIMSTDEIRSYSVVHVTCPDLYEKNIPKMNGLYDLRMGTTDKSMLCETCKSDIINCQGHFGHIDLAFPVYNVCYIKQVFKILQCVCMRCSSVLLTDDYKKVYTSLKKVRANLRFRRIYEQVKKQFICPDCEFKQPKWSMDASRIDCAFAVEEQSPEMTSKIALNILRKISDTDCILMGFHPKYSHPKNMIIEALLVSPPVVRPSVMMDPSMRTQDDLTHKLIEIIKTNQMVEKCIKGTHNIFTEHVRLLQFHVSTMIDNDIPGQPQATQRTGRPIKSISQRIKSKEGRVRGNIMGKRVDFSARTVITAEPNIRLDELGVPESIARNLTYSERVTGYNKTFLQKCVNNGPDPKDMKDVGAKYVITANEQRKDLRFAKEFEIHEGDVVERHLMDGDYVVFNRQPTLHKMSMMGHRVKVMSGKTFRLNLSACSSYNADFDGDEMNLFLPCTHDARAEVKELMMVSHNIVSPQGNRPVMGIVQDALLACSKLTRRDVFLTKEQFTNIMFQIDKTDIPPPCIWKPIPLWSGKQLFSLILPKCAVVSLTRHAAQHDDIDDPENCSFNFADTEVVIQHGELLSGILCKKTLGTSSGGLVHKLWTELGPDAACDFISYTQFMANNWLVDNGFSVGISDCVNLPIHQKWVDTIVSDCIQDAHKVINNAEEKGISPDNYEHSLNQILNRARDTSGRLVQQQMTSKNNLYSMVSGGSKGSVINIAQIMACVGQQNVNGQRIAYGYTDRTLPHFKRYDNTPAGRGFVQHSYIQGLLPHEFFFHAMGGREGVIDTAIKTSDSGYTQRRLVKAMEDLSIQFDGTVRNSIGDILQFKYGEDNMDGSKLIAQSVGGSKVYLPLDIRDSVEHRSHVFGRYTVDNPKLTNSFNRALKHLDVSAYDTYVLQRHREATITPGEMVGIIAAQSLGQPITQMTLNSVEYNTEIVVVENGKLKEYRVGEWIERRIDQGDYNTYHYIENGDQIYAPVHDDVRILTSDENGRVFWDHVDAVTRHLPINEDGTHTLIRVTTLSGHECTVTKGESVLTRQNNKLLKSKGSDLRVGDYLPALREFPVLEECQIHTLHLIDYLPENEFVFPSEMVCPEGTVKPKGCMQSMFIRLRDALSYPFRHMKSAHKPGHVYPNSIQVQQPHFPARLVLDELFGFVIGAFLAHGHVNTHNVLIPNTDSGVIKRIKQWVRRIGLNSKYNCCIPSIVMARLFTELFICTSIEDGPVVIDKEGDSFIDGLAYNIQSGKHTVSSTLTKHLPLFLLGAPEECLRGIVDGYFCGVGVVSLKRTRITAQSVSRSLLDNISILLQKFGVRSSIRKYQMVRSFDCIETMSYILQIQDRDCVCFAKTFTLTWESKQKRLNLHATKSLLNSQYDIFPEVSLSDGSTRDLTLDEILAVVDVDSCWTDSDRTVCQTILDGGLYYDRVVSIEEVQSRHTHVFDLTTRISRNFADKRIVLNDTFHSAGISTMNVTLGVPRLKELINVSKNIKSPCMSIKPRSKELVTELVGVYLNDFVSQIHVLSKVESPTYEQEYMSLMEINEFHDSIKYTEWSIRYDIDANKLSLHDLDLLDVTMWINKTFPHVWCCCSDENVETPTILVRLFSNNNGLDTMVKMKQLSHKISCETVIHGYKNITRCFENPDGTIDTMGIDMENLMANPNVDPYHTRCNDVITIYNILGIEAARQVLCDEISKVIEFDGSYVDYRHTAMLIDTMTYKGSLMAITRHGMNRTETGVLMRCSFEETMNVITDAAAFAEYNPICGVTENIIMGKMASLGTGTMNVMMDTEKFMSYFEDTNGTSFAPSSPIRYHEFDDSYFPE